ncbi:uncharacterized protein PV07_02541 [Cladophialophora immunda]|uniref:Uncharacterized protein n=1 Tax=Cladophialophora immunda TaxID=569365 RepID=A0A0D2CI76_9EURO|nr:uncharacterized protein PV07_02541 [Cladophialophora immunda]KIW30848.1 hypothetical protein PV07_02541 [Cladophialophora immunda]
MTLQDTPICDDPQPQESDSIIETYFSLVCGRDGVKPSDFDEYFTSYKDETALLLLKGGEYRANRWKFPIHTHRHAIEVVEILQMNASTAHRDEVRKQVRQRLSLPPTSSFEAEDEAIDFTLRLWLMINFRDPQHVGLGQGRPPIVWRNNRTLSAQVESLFAKSTTELSPLQRRLHPNFKAVNLVNICRLKLKWTSSLEDHLRLDRDHNTLWIFPGRRFLKFAAGSSTLPICAELLDETSRTLDLLFPSWDQDMKRMMKKLKRDFHRVHCRDRSLDLRHYLFWRDRLLELYEDVYLAPPGGWAQLWYDQRDPQKFWTFWVALVVLVLTVLSTVATLLQTVLALRQS